MAINFIKKEDLSHITRTTRQWETTIDRYEIIPKGVLCIELCNDKLTKIKIGNGHLIYEQLPYVSDVNLSDYYTKEETNNLIKDLKCIKIKGEASSLSDLPLHGNEEGDLWFIPKSDPDTHNRYDEYIWYKNKWESFGSSDIDLSEYAKKSYVDMHIQEVQNEITEIIESGYLHKHDNKNILDHTSAVYNVEKDNKLRDLHNYDDTELREKAHTHLNKNILDQTDAVYNRDKDDKLSSLHNYDDTDVKDRISTLEGVAHSHSNQDILNRTTAAFTREQAMILLDCKDFVGTDGVHDGYHGFVPAPTAADAGKVLGSNGQWVEGGGTGGDTIAQGGGIEITTDSQTGVKTVSVNAGTGLSIDPDTGELNADAQALEPATTTTLGGVIIGDGISVDNDGVIDVNTGDGLSVNNDNELEVSVGDGLQIDANGAVEVDTGNGLNINQNDELEVSLGDGLQFDQNGAIEVNVGDGLSINASDEVELDKATTSAIGGVIVGDNIDVNNGTISVPKAASNKLGVVKPTDGLSIDSNGELSVNVGDGLSVDSTNNDINVNTGRALSINSSTKAVDVDIASNSSYGCVKIGEGIDVDQYGIISVDKMVPFRAGDGLELVDESVRLPSGYAKVKYVENPSGAAIAAPFNPRSYPNAKVAVKFSRTSLSSSGNIEYVFGAEIYVSGARYFNLGFFNKAADTLPLYAGFVYGSNSWNTQTDANGGRSTDIDVGDIIYAECSVGEGLKMNNEQIHNVTNVGGESLPYIDLGVFANRRRADQYTIYTENCFVGRIYSFKIYDGKNVILNLIPAVRLSDNVVGFYSYTNDTFYPSITEVPFTTDMETLDIEVPDWVMNVTPATTDTIGGIKVGSGLSATNDGTLSVNTGDGLTIDTNNNLKAKIGTGLHFNENNAIEADEIDIDTYEPGNGISFIRHYVRDLPVGYTQLEYIESRFDAGFILDYYPQKTSRIVCEAAYVDINRSTPSDNCLFGSRNGNASGSKQFVFWFNNKTSDPCYIGFVYSGNTWGDIGEHYTYANMHQRLLFEISPSIGVYCNNVQIQNPLSHPTYDPSPYKLGILCLATSDTGIDTTRNYQSGRIFTFKIYESDTLVVDLVPCLNDSDVPGLYDMVGEVFYPSASGTDFSYDPDAVVTHDSITIDANRGPGIIYDNNALSLNPGSGLSIDATDNQKLNVNLADGLSIKNTSTNAIKINTGDGLSIDSTSNKLNVNIGDGLVKDSSNNIDVNLYDNDLYINTYNQLCINPLYAPTYEAGNGVQFVSTSPYNLPPNYTKLSCVESKNSGTDKSAFRLNYVPTTETKFDVLFGITKASFSDVTIIGSGGSNTAKYSLNITRSSAATNNTTVRFNYCQDNSSTSTSFTTAIGDILHIVADKNGVYVNNNLVQTPVQTGSPSSYKLCVGSSPATNDATSFRDPSTPGKYYDIKIYEGSTLTVHLIPCLNDSNVPGMYDEVNELFHHNEWKTDFHYDENEKTRPGYYVQAKLGNGLQFDANNAIEVVNGGTEYTAGDGIDIDANDEISVKIGNHLSFDQTTGDINVDDIIEYRAGEAISIETVGGLQLTDYSNDDFVTSIASMNAGSIVKAADNSSFTLTASNNDCYTRGSSGEANGSYPYNVKASTKYRLTWDSSSDAIHGKVYTYENGLYDTWMHEIDQYDQKYLEFTTKAETTFITTRFGVMYAGDSITYSNVRLYEFIEDEDAYDEISVKYGDGLTVNQDNELEVVLSAGLEFDPNATETMTADEMYLFESRVECQVHTDSPYSGRPTDRVHQKTTTEPALCCLWEVYDSGYLWTGPLFVGLTSTSVQYTTHDTQQTINYQNTFTYLDKTWYTSGYPDFLNDADHEDKLGNLQYLGSYASVSYQIQAAKDLIDLANVQFISHAGIQAKLGDGLFIDSTNNDINVKIGQALSINNSNEIDVNLGRALSINNDNEIDVDIATATSLGVVKAGSGLNIDEFGNLSTQATPFRIGRALSLDDESVRLPSAYYKAKYVESNGSANTTIPFNPSSYPNAKCVVKASVESAEDGYRHLFGTERQNTWTGAYSLCLYYLDTDTTMYTRFNYATDADNNVYAAYALSYGLGDIIDIECSRGEGLKINNEVIQTTSAAWNSLSSYELAIFGLNVGNGVSSGVKGRIYSFKVYNGDTLIHNLVPAVRKSDNVVGFYNTSNNTFYSSIQSTEFTTDMDDLDVDDPDWVLNANIATSNSLGVVKPSTGLIVNEHGALTLDKASASTIGGVKVGNNLSIDSNGVLTANIINYSSGHAIEITGDLSIDKFRWEITKNAGDSMVAFRYFEYSDSSHIPFTVQSGTIEWSDGSTVSYPSGYDETFAGMMENRTKCTVTGWTGTKTLIMTFRLSQSIMLSDIAYFRWKTDDYMSGRQPTEFNIYAHDSINDEWILLKEVTDHALVPSSGNTWSDYIDIEPEIEPGAINVKYGNGLTLNQNNELEVPVASSSTLGIVKIGHGVEIDPYGAIYVDAMVPFAAGVGLELIPGSSSEDALPEGYGKVDYIETNGSAYTIINYVPNRNTKVVGTALFRRDNWDPVVFGCRKGGGNGKQFVLWFDRYSSNQAKVGFVYGTNTWDTSTDANGGRIIPYITGDQFSFLISVDDDCNINNTFVHNITDNGAPASNLNLGIFALAVTNSSIESDDTIFNGRLYDFKIYENDELVVNLVPAVRLEDEKVGFYDNINDAFYPSLSSSNQFTTDMDSMVIDYQDTTLNTRLGTGLKYSIDNKIETNISSGQGIDISVDNQNGLLVSTKLAQGLKFNLDDEIEVDIGDGLQFDTNNKLALDLRTALINGNGISITPQTSILPAGYGQLSYIEGTGQQWTQLDYVATHDSRVVVDCISYETTSTGRALFGCREGTGGRPQFVLWVGQKTTGYVTASFVYGSNVWDNDYNTGVAVGERFTVDASYNGLYINGELFKSITDQGSMPAYKVALFTVANGDGTYITDKGMGKYRIYSFKIYEGNDLVVDLVPAISASTGVGLYDVVNDKFYTSLTATPFTYDPTSVVYPSSYQIATKIGSGLQYDSNGAIEAIPAGLTPATASTLGGVIVGNGLTVTSDGTISTVTGKAYIAGEGINLSSSQYEFSAENEQYLFKSQVTCELHGDFNREFQKTTDDTALGIIWNVYDSGTLYSGPVFVGLSSDSVKYTTNNTTYSALGTFSYLGKTWYYSDHQYYVSNIDGTDYDGNMVVDTETSTSTSELVDFCKSLIDRARVILKVDEISLLPATEDTLGGIKIGEGLSIDENNVVSSTVYEEGQGITFETSGSTDSFDVKNKEYYFTDEAKCEITGNFGPRAYWRVYTDDPCLAVIFYRSDNTTAPLYIGLTANSVKMYQTWDGNVLGPTGTFAYKGYSWYYSYEYGLYYSSGVDQLGHLQTISGTSSDDLEDVAKHVIDLAELISPGIKTYDVWNTGTGWLNGSYADGTSDSFYTSWYKEYHSDNTEYFELPKGATEVKLTGISTSDTAFGGNHIDLFNDAKHHIGTFTGESQWHELLPGTVYLQYGVKWSENNDRNISSSDIKSVTLEIKVPKNNAITAKLGDGLTFDENDAITLDESIKLIIHCVGSPIS